MTSFQELADPKNSITEKGSVSVELFDCFTGIVISLYIL